MLIGSNAVDSFTARSFYQNYNVIPTSHTAPTICFCILEVRRKEERDPHYYDEYRIVLAGTLQENDLQRAKGKRIFPFMTHMLCCHIEKYFHLPPVGVGPFAPCLKLGSLSLTI